MPLACNAVYLEIKIEHEFCFSAAKVIVELAEELWAMVRNMEAVLLLFHSPLNIGAKKVWRGLRKDVDRKE